MRAAAWSVIEISSTAARTISAVGVVVGHQQRHGAHLDTGDVGRVGVVDQPAVEQAAVLAGAVVPPDALGGDLDADRGQARVGHAAHRARRR